MMSWTATLPFKAVAAGIVATGLLLWADKTMPHVGVWALLLLSVSVGFVHGALDAVLLPQRFASRAQVGGMFLAYLVLVLLLGWVFSAAVSVALWALLLMSAWHFGEPYGRWDGLAAWQSGLTRIVVGGAPVMLPVWLAPDQLAVILQNVVPAAGVQGWHVMAWVWLGLAGLWVLLCGARRMQTLRYAWLELMGCMVTYALLSPLMAFAVYFGIYHAPVHVWRVWRACDGVAQNLSGRAVSVIAAVALTTAITWLLGGALWWFTATGEVAATDWSAALRWLIVVFAALTAPHLVLISLCAAFLTRPELDR